MSGGSASGSDIRSSSSSYCQVLLGSMPMSACRLFLFSSSQSVRRDCSCCACSFSLVTRWSCEARSAAERVTSCSPVMVPAATFAQRPWFFFRLNISDFALLEYGFFDVTLEILAFRAASILRAVASAWAARLPLSTSNLWNMDRIILRSSFIAGTAAAETPPLDFPAADPFSVAELDARPDDDSLATGFIKATPSSLASLTSFPCLVATCCPSVLLLVAVSDDAAATAADEGCFVPSAEVDAKRIFL
mmetsp:Transcript_32178/g.70901  ORF Transcript_32178/g.70901 Transcript_32178/m.70901 type:complete len:248 (+) Transcript_32178:110-853(+)